VVERESMKRAYHRVVSNKGSVGVSPLLLNIMLDDLDKELERRGHRFCRKISTPAGRTEFGEKACMQTPTAVPDGAGVESLEAHHAVNTDTSWLR
jgi:hypothetical protein